MILPNSNSGNPNTDMMFRLIDEKLSELYSQQGEQTPRGTINLSEQTITRDVSPASNRLYSNALVKAWASMDSTGTLREGYNIADITRVALGQYRFSFRTPMTSARYSYVAIPMDLVAVMAVGDSATQTVDHFMVLTYTHAGAAADSSLCVMVTGNQ